MYHNFRPSFRLGQVEDLRAEVKVGARSSCPRVTMQTGDPIAWSKGTQVFTSAVLSRRAFAPLTPRTQAKTATLTMATFSPQASDSTHRPEVLRQI